VVYPDVATYCSKYEAGCCASCDVYKNESNVGKIRRLGITCSLKLTSLKKVFEIY